MQNQNNNQTNSPLSDDDLMHGAAIVNDKGEEKPITDEMVQKSLKLLLSACTDTEEKQS